MAKETSVKQKNNLSLDWLMRGSLAKFGEWFDRLTGRNWQPSSSLATSELIERLKILLDREARDLGSRGRFVPHNIKLKMQWDKFSTDAEKALTTLENELLTAAVDHINDNRYHTFAPLNLEIKQDYFTDGVKLHASFGRFEDVDEDAELNVTLPDVNKNKIAAAIREVDLSVKIIARFTINNNLQTVNLRLAENGRLSIGRNKENDLAIDDISISKVHASLGLTSQSNIQIADTGSTNGTFINGQRIPYGKSLTVNSTDSISFGNIEVKLDVIPQPIVNIEVEDNSSENSVVIGEFEFKSKANMKSDLNKESANSDEVNRVNKADRTIKVEADNS